MPAQPLRSRKAPPRNKEWLNKFKKVISSPSEWSTLIKDLLFNPSYNFYFMLFLIPVELILNIFIVYRIPYTEIDWVAYMSEVEGFVNGTFNYYELKGDTGPLVYIILFYGDFCFVFPNCFNSFLLTLAIQLDLFTYLLYFTQ